MSNLQKILFDSFQKDNSITKDGFKSILNILEFPMDTTIMYLTKESYSFSEYEDVLTKIFVNSEKSIPDRLKLFDTNNSNIDEIIKDILNEFKN